MSCVVQGPSLHERCRFCLNDKKILSQEAHDLWKRPMGFSFFFHGLGSSLITTVGSERPENITFQGKRQKKSAMGRSVPKRWAQVDFTEVFRIWQAGACDSGNKIAASAHGMGSGG